MEYFRVKRLRLGTASKNFLEKNLPPGGTVFIAECQRTWPTTQVGDRHFFQFGALGGATEAEFFQGGDRKGIDWCGSRIHHDTCKLNSRYIKRALPKHVYTTQHLDAEKRQIGQTRTRS